MKRMRDGSYTVPPAFTVRPGDSLSTMLLARADAHPDQVVVADWEAAISAHPELLYDDQIHPLPEGGDLYAQTVADAVASLKRQPSS